MYGIMEALGIAVKKMTTAYTVSGGTFNARVCLGPSRQDEVVRVDRCRWVSVQVSCQSLKIRFKISSAIASASKIFLDLIA